MKTFYIAAVAACTFVPVNSKAIAASAPAYKATLVHPTEYSFSWIKAGAGMSWVGGGSGPAEAHALLWNNAKGTLTDLNPRGYDLTAALDVSGASQVGYGYSAATNFIRQDALLWNSTAESVVNLNPLGFEGSQARGVSGDSQVGFGYSPTLGKIALLWNGDPESYVNLNPAGYANSEAWAISGDNQVGWGVPRRAARGEGHALLWSGTAESVVNLHPSGFVYSEALDVWGDSQVGQGSMVVPTSLVGHHALLWNGTADSVADLHPDGFEYPSALAVSAVGQVGFGRGPATDSQEHALLWNGAADSVVDLHPYLDGLGLNFDGSSAEDITEDGTIVGWASVGFDYYAIVWRPIPEPSAIVMTLLSGCWMLCMRPWLIRTR